MKVTSTWIILTILMPKNVFGDSCHDDSNKIDTSLFVKKPFLRTIYIESNKEEDIDLKN